jgi:EmrB/QacA subfamily drug resistance transporter
LLDNNQTPNTNKNILLIATSLASFSASLLSIAVSVALPTIGKEFKMEAHLLGWVATSFILAAAVAMVPLGRVADIYGRKKVFSYGIVLFIVSSLLCAASQSPILLICLQVFQGIGAAMIWGPAMAILTSAMPPEERGRAIGINTAAIYCGLSIGPFWGGFLTQNIGWRGVFYITAILVIIAAVFVFWKIKDEWSDSQGEKMDVKGSITLVVALVLTLYGFSSLPSLISLPYIIIGLAGMWLFYRIETRTARPVLNVSLFRGNRIFVFALLGMLALYCATFAPNFLLSFYLQYNKGFSPQTAGAIMIVQFVIMAIIAPFAGRISDKTEPLRVSAFGMAVSCIGLVLFAFVSEESSIWLVLAGLIVLGFGFGFFASPAANAIMSSVDKKYFGVAAGSQATMRHTGQVLSMGIVMILFAIYIGNAEITPQNYPAFMESFRTAFIIFAALGFIGIFAMLGGGRLRNRTPGSDNVGDVSVSHHQN